MKPTGLCSAHQNGEDPNCKICYLPEKPGVTAEELFKKYSKNCVGYREKFINKKDFTAALAEAMCDGQVQPVVMPGGDSESGCGWRRVKDELPEYPIQFDNKRLWVYDGKEVYETSLQPNMWLSTITHWKFTDRDIPKPPEA